MSSVFSDETNFMSELYRRSTVGILEEVTEKYPYELETLYPPIIGLIPIVPFLSF